MSEFKSPINKFQQLLVIMSEESGELTQASMKALRACSDINDFQDSKFQEKLIEEAGDVYCMLQLMVDYKLINWISLEKRSNEKRDKLKIWSTLIDD